tara:strand:- start:115 stop:435 length:321 start_codon:yes stop_codon:yes gene_type:complete
MLEDRLIYTNHAKSKMRHYGISANLVKRVIRYPDRVEEAIVDNLIAAMKKTRSKSYPELWVMYEKFSEQGSDKLKIITAWRYPAESDERDPIPENILQEVRKIIGF